MTIRLLLDAQLPPSLCEPLRQAGVEALHVIELDMLAASDEAIWRKALEIGAVIVSKDEDFVQLAKRKPEGCPQVLWMRCGNLRNQALWRALEPRLLQILDALQAGERIIEFNDR